MRRESAADRDGENAVYSNQIFETIEKNKHIRPAPISLHCKYSR